MMASPLPAAPPLPIAAALTLSERLAVLRARGHLLRDDALDPGQGRRWVDKLKAMPPFDKFPRIWERFLAAQRLTEDALVRVLSAPDAFLAEHAPAAAREWASQLEEALAEDGRERRSFTWPPEMGPQANLLAFSRPVIAWALGRIQRGLAAAESAAGQPLVAPGRFEALFLPPLVRTAFSITHRALVLELNVARIQGELPGETPAERFAAFVARLEDPASARALYAEYAVLSRLLVEGLQSIADFCVSFLRHLAEDRALLRDTLFGGQDAGPLTRATLSGDGHRGGKRVLVLEFQGGRKALYKPRSLRGDVHFQELLEWLNARGCQPPLRAMTCLDRGAYGWAEFIEASGCTEEAQLRRFYLRQGSLLAVLYAMLATDFHYENLIARGEQPVLIDLESLFHPVLRPLDQNQLEESLWSAFHYSVLRTALLPSFHLVGDSGVPLDVSGLHDVEGQQAPFAAPYVDMSVSDEARIQRTHLRMGGNQNVPTLHGVRPNAAAYTPEILEGFTGTYRFLLEHREALLAPEGPLRRFTGDSVRFIFRNTRSYALLLRETQHPDVQRNALERERHFVRLWSALEQRQDVAGLVDAELRALWMGDVPFFHTRTDSVDLLDHEDGRHPGLLARSCLDEVEEHVRRLDEADLKRQTWFIQGAMACLQLGVGHATGTGGSRASVQPVSGAAGAPGREVFLQEARRVADRLAETALRGRGDEGASWLGMLLLRERVWQFLPLGIDLYNGLPGIALFLAYLARASGESRYEDLARHTLAVIRRQQQQHEARITITGAFSGWGGLLYLYTHLYALWREPRLLEEALACARKVRERAAEDQDFDVIYGNAGAVLALEALHAVHPAPEVLDVMRACGQRLLSEARPMERGVGWASQSLGGGPLAGYSHGASGFACALDVLFRRTGEEAYRTAAVQALDYERTLFSAERHNWRDLRPFGSGQEKEPPAPRYPAAWCNGSPGVGLARLRMPSLEAAALRTDIQEALLSTRQEGFGYNHSLCHGDLGNLELLLEVREAGLPLLQEGEVEQWAAGILEGIRRQGWLCGTPRGLETPGLLTGLAGIGYGFLRLHDAANTPSLLLLDAPR